MKQKIRSWLKALRLKFYPMSWVTYTIGALLVVGPAEAFTAPAYWTGFAFMFFLEVATVLSNEYFDYQTDRMNRSSGPYSGGSRVLVDGELSFDAIRAGIGVAFMLTLVAAAGVLTTSHGSLPATALLLVVLTILALGYTVPPLKLSYRTLGELDVAVTDSIGVMLCGFVFLGGAWLQPLPWLLSLPLLLAFIPSITLSAIPDYEADRATGKRTIAVRFGIGGAVNIARISAYLAALSAIVLHVFELVPHLYGPFIYLSALHAVVLSWLLHRRLGNESGGCRIDNLILVSLGFVVWFGVLPLASLLR